MATPEQLFHFSGWWFYGRTGAFRLWEQGTELFFGEYTRDGGYVQGPCKRCPDCGRAEFEDVRGKLVFQLRPPKQGTQGMTLTHVPPGGEQPRQQSAYRNIALFTQAELGRLRFRDGVLSELAKYADPRHEQQPRVGAFGEAGLRIRGIAPVSRETAVTSWVPPGDSKYMCSMDTKLHTVDYWVLFEEASPRSRDRSPGAATSVTRFVDRYAVTRPAKRVEQVNNWVKDILVGCAELPGAGPLEEFLEMYEELHKAVDARPRAGADSAAARAARFWTAGDLPKGGAYWGPDMNATYNGRQIEFCTWVGHAVCFGGKALLERVVPYIRTLNLFPRHDMSPVWNKLRANSWRLYRGSGFDAAHRDWYRPGLKYRQLRAVATSLKRATALQFARRGWENGEWPVLWVIEVEKEFPHCHHIRHIGPGVSFSPEENEFLFPNASVFTVKRVKWQRERRSNRPSLIVLRAARDNREHPLDLPVAPRS